MSRENTLVVVGGGRAGATGAEGARAKGFGDADSASSLVARAPSTRAR